MVRLVLSIVGGSVLLALVIIGFMAWTPTPPRLDEDAIRTASARYSARIIRDDYGVPHIYGETDSDVAFGLAWAHAEDDWETIEPTLLAARGVLARYDGQDAAPTDYIVQLLRIQETVAARYESDLAEDTRALLEGYADGMNAWGLENPDRVRPGVLPITGQDVVAGFVLRTPFMYGLDEDLGELFAEERQRTISIGETETAWHSIDGPNPELGSNAIAVAPSRSADGHTRLIVNSHQPFTGPVAWYEIRVHSEEGWDAAGGTFPGAPLVLHGHNRNLGWAHTVNNPDLADIYVLEINPDNDNQYRLDGEWVDFETGTAALRVHLFGPFSWVFNRELVWSAHGPVVRRPHGTYAIRWSGFDEVRGVEQWYRMNRAEDFEAWMDAMNMQAITSLNTIYADRDGHIAYLYNARMPVRAEGYDWRQYLPGDRSELIWSEYEPLANLPVVIDPPSGYVANANNTPFRATSPADDLNSADFPSRFGIEWEMTNRAQRLLPLLEADTSITDEELLEYKFDLDYAADSPVARLVAELVAMDLDDEPLLIEAQRVLGEWDFSTNVDNRSAALGVLIAIKCIQNRHDTHPWTCEPVEALRRSALDLMDHYGRLDPSWGDVNRHVRGAFDSPVDGGPDILRAIYCGCDELDEDGHFIGMAGDTYIMAVEWDETGAVYSRAIHQFGSATLDERSPHYADQAGEFVAMELREIPLEMDALMAVQESDITIP
ncbi:acylase [Hyphobacterium sp. HN65]|uniref:Acylase n=1 Tax=Hyphobacterium lacteum TaxID=3116575 RepID=A0ABU7LR54_9PROT|nr:acylase [Hyphobacterium sp. HN65]MEE2526365.1 acylase [Hyphobacterium sp. HN65]